MSRLPHFPNEFNSAFAFFGVFQMQTIVLLISGSSYIHPGAVERSGEGSVCGHGSVGPDCGFDSDTWSGAVLCQGEH